MPRLREVGGAMNNLQHIVKDNTRFAMHMAVELCEQGDFDSVAEAFKWLNQETVCNYARWHELFGTPERAARVIVALNNCRVVGCVDCAARGACRYDGCGDDYDALLEWLRGDA